jgi:hypothetical protein
MSNLKEFISKTKQDKGATYNLETGELNPKSGYFVGIKGAEYKLGNEDLDIQHFVLENSVHLSDRNNFVGSWVENGLLYLDVVVMFDSLKEAKKEGVNRGQLAIYDANNKNVIEL